MRKRNNRLDGCLYFDHLIAVAHFSRSRLTHCAAPSWSSGWAYPSMPLQAGNPQADRTGFESRMSRGHAPLKTKGQRRSCPERLPAAMLSSHRIERASRIRLRASCRIARLFIDNRIFTPPSVATRIPQYSPIVRLQLQELTQRGPPPHHYPKPLIRKSQLIDYKDTIGFVRSVLHSLSAAPRCTMPHNAAQFRPPPETGVLFIGVHPRSSAAKLVFLESAYTLNANQDDWPLMNADPLTRRSPWETENLMRRVRLKLCLN